MAEPFARPQQKDIDKLMKFAEDPLFYWAMITGIKALDGLGKEDTSIPIQEFYRNCRLMILNYPAIQVYSILDIAVHDIANQSYENLSIPEPSQKPKVNYSKIDLKELTLTKIADYYGLEPLGRKVRVCPFHKDKDPSLSLSNEKNCFHCFGCNVSGDVLTFIGMLEELKNGS